LLFSSLAVKSGRSSGRTGKLRHSSGKYLVSRQSKKCYGEERRMEGLGVKTGWEIEKGKSGIGSGNASGN